MSIFGLEGCKLPKKYVTPVVRFSPLELTQLPLKIISSRKTQNQNNGFYK